MRIFKLVNDTPGTANKFVGFHVDTETDNLLTLMAISRTVSKSSLLRELVNLSTKENEAELISDVARRALAIWQYRGEDWKPPIVEFKSGIDGDLKRKGVPMAIRMKILSRFNTLLKGIG